MQQVINLARHQARQVSEITIMAGRDKFGQAETIAELTVEAGQSLAVVGPTGSGKTELLSDIEQWAERDTITGRRLITVGGSRVRPQDTGSVVARLSQKTSFVMDSSVEHFLSLHAECRNREQSNVVKETLDAANQLCGEPIHPNASLQVLSGGQSRALMIADIAFISDAPVVLIDEIENAGIDKLKALSVLAASHKPILVATHDPILMLMAPRRLVMKDGGMQRLIETPAAEKEYLGELRRMDGLLCQARDLIRDGKILAERELGL
jgi:ABC-type lipoprotein export system ATPase subunit